MSSHSRIERLGDIEDRTGLFAGFLLVGRQQEDLREVLLLLRAVEGPLEVRLAAAHPHPLPLAHALQLQPSALQDAPQKNRNIKE